MRRNVGGKNTEGLFFHCSQHMMLDWNPKCTIEDRALFVSLMEKSLLPRAKHESYIGTSTRVYKPI